MGMEHLLSSSEEVWWAQERVREAEEEIRQHREQWGMEREDTRWEEALERWRVWERWTMMGEDTRRRLREAEERHGATQEGRNMRGGA